MPGSSTRSLPLAKFNGYCKEAVFFHAMKQQYKLSNLFVQLCIKILSLIMYCYCIAKFIPIDIFDVYLLITKNLNLLFQSVLLQVLIVISFSNDSYFTIKMFCRDLSSRTTENSILKT